MSTAADPRLWTVEEFERRPTVEWEELIDGEVFDLSPNVKKGHSEVVWQLGVALRPLERQGYKVLNGFACAFTRKLHSLPNPDLGVVAEQDWDAVPGDGYLDHSPALAVEVHSPSNRQLQRKAALYLEYGAEQVWLVYAASRRVRVLTRAR